MRLVQELIADRGAPRRAESAALTTVRGVGVPRSRCRARWSRSRRGLSRTMVAEKARYCACQIAVESDSCSVLMR